MVKIIQIRQKPVSDKKIIFQIMICLADTAIWMSNFDDFDDDQISWKLDQR